MRKYILLGLLVLTALFALGMEINTAARCQAGIDCNIGKNLPSGITLDTSNGDLNVGSVTADTVTMTALTTNTAVFQGADAAGAADTTFDTTGAGAIILGSADVTTITLTNTGAIAVGVAATDSITLVTDGGTATVDGYVQADVGPFITLASGTLTANTIHLATAAADYTVPACVAANVGEWVTIISQDVNEVISLLLADASNTFSISGAIIAAGDEADSEGHTTTGDGEHLTLVCVVAEFWMSTSMGGTWIDGGSS